MSLGKLVALAAAAMMPLAACASSDVNPNSQEMTTSTICITIDGVTMTANLVDNSSASALVDKLQQGPVTYHADDYGGFEKVGALGFTLPRNDQQVTTSPGDIILYQGSNLCLYYARNSWNFTSIGKINYSSESQLKSFLKAGDGPITVTLSLPADAINDATADGTAATVYDLHGRVARADAKGPVIERGSAKRFKR